MISLEKGEEIIRVTKPHGLSFVDSVYFWLGGFFVLVAFSSRLRLNFGLFSFILIVIGLLLVVFSYIRRVAGYMFYLTNHRIVSDYRFIRKLHREVSYDELVDVVEEKRLFGKIFGYSDVWLFGYRKDWIVG